MRHLIFLFAIIIFCGCTTQPLIVNCVMSYAKTATAIGFEGFSVTSLDTVIVYYYPPDSTFSHLIKTDTVLTTSIYTDSIYEFRNDSLSYMSSASFASADTNDLEIYLPANRSRFFIHPVYNVSAYHYTNPGHCLPPQISFPDLYVNGQLTKSTNFGYINYIFISP